MTSQIPEFLDFLHCIKTASSNLCEKIFCVEIQGYPLKFYTKYLTYTLKEAHLGPRFGSPLLDLVPSLLYWPINIFYMNIATYCQSQTWLITGIIVGWLLHIAPLLTKINWGNGAGFFLLCLSDAAIHPQVTSFLTESVVVSLASHQRPQCSLEILITLARCFHSRRLP